MIATMDRSRFLVLVATLSCVATFCSPALAQDKPRGVAETPNAALRYWTAFALLDAADPAKFNVEDNWREGPITEQAREQLKKLDSAFVYLHLAAMTEHCDWQLETESLKNLPLPHLSEARRMYRCAVYRARMYLADGEPGQAQRLMTDIAAMGRHLGSNTLFVCLMVQFATEEVAMEFAAKEFVSANGDKRQLAELADAWLKLPTGGTVVSSAEYEWALHSVWLREQSVIPVWADFKITQIDSQRQAILAFVNLPYGERIKQLPELREQVKAAPLAELLLDSIVAALAAEDRLNAKRAMLLVGIDIAINGPDAVKKHMDPFADNQPFTYEAHEGGFTLRSALTIPQRGDAPVELTFGKAKK